MKPDDLAAAIRAKQRGDDGLEKCVRTTCRAADVIEQYADAQVRSHGRACLHGLPPER